MFRLLSALVACLWVTAATAQDAPPYDPNYIPWDPVMKQFDDCGVRMALDPRWPLEKTVEPGKWGGVRTDYRALLGPDFWKTDKRPFARVSLQPTVLFSVECFQGKSDTVKKFDGFVKRYRKAIAAKSAGRKVQVKKLKNTGAERAYVMTSARKNPKSYRFTDRVEVLAFHRGRVVMVYFDVSRQAGGGYVDDVRIGELATGTLKTGEVLTARMTGQGKRSLLNGLLAYSRAKKMNQALFDDVVGSFRAY